MNHPTERRTVLVVEDDGAIRHAIAELLKDEGYSAVAVSDLRSAVLVLQRHPLSAIVLDWRLEGETAASLLEKLGREGSKTPVVLVSAAPEVEAIAARHAVRFVRKPLDFDTLTETLDLAIREGSAPRLNG